MSQTPLISICLASLNYRSYLPHCFESIFAQTLEDWELIVSDSYSDDGAWEYIQEMAHKDPRTHPTQAPRDGMYANWNRCIARARGKYVYLATSDDTMAPDCLQELAQALEDHPGCDLAHCLLRTIDSEGRDTAELLWPDSTAFAAGDPYLLQRRHLRYAPYDGLLHLTGRITYLSLTQLLIRRTLFSKIGVFPTRWGSIGDINWDMKAGMVANVIHVPDTWASFRVHPIQATASVDFLSTRYAEMYDQMVDDAFVTCKPYLPGVIAAGLESSWLRSSRELRNYYLALRREPIRLRRLWYQATSAVLGPATVRSELAARLVGKPAWPLVAHSRLRQWIESATGRPVIMEVIR